MFYLVLRSPSCFTPVVPKVGVGTPHGVTDMSVWGHQFLFKNLDTKTNDEKVCGFLEMMQTIKNTINKIKMFASILAFDVDCIVNKPLVTDCKSPCKLNKCRGSNPLTFLFYGSEAGKFGNHCFTIHSVIQP